MAKIHSFKESKIIKMINESANINLDYYHENDFVDAFSYLFRNWLGNKIGEEAKKFPFSYLLIKYGKEFLKESLGDQFYNYFNDDSNINFSGSQFAKIGKYLIIHGVHTLPSLRPEVKFTEKYKKHIQYFIDNLRLGSQYKVELQEPEPYYVAVKVTIDFPTLLKSPDNFVNHREIMARLKFDFENYLGVNIDNPVYGGLKLYSHSELENVEGWVQNVLNKQIKKDIRKKPEAKYLHSIRFEPAADENSTIELKWKSDSWRARINEHKFREEVRQYLKDLGYTKIDVR